MPVPFVTYNQGDRVRHAMHGIGTVLSDLGQTVVVRFGQVIHECARGDLELLPSVLARLDDPLWDAPLKLVNHLQAEAIASANDSWGVFARSRIDLLPHQIWVCRKVNEQWPTRWLVADDVGLGKSIEAGIILTPLLASGKVKRLLILCGASLVSQWMERMKDMFDIRLYPYTPEADTNKTGFFDAFQQIVASFQTLRKDSNGRLLRLLEAEPWDLVLFDESHHLNADEKSYTLTYNLIKSLNEAGRIKSMIFFSGTPHRGKNFGFLAQLKLLRDDLFDPRADLLGQLSSLKQVMIRNNKYEVTNLEGKPLFQKHLVITETYEYSSEEDDFYQMLTRFILEGKAYASGLPASQGSAVTLVLIAMQKLASSSVAAIRSAIEGRLSRMTTEDGHLASLRNERDWLIRHSDLSEPDMADELARMDEEIVTTASHLRLMKNEEPALRSLLEAAQRVTSETKILRIMDEIERRFPERNVLLFTEYKATQSLVMSELMKRYGRQCVTFINGDEEVVNVLLPNGDIEKSIKQPRTEAAEAFNSGEVRFLVSTEAGGEGIDLQDNCSSMVQVDLPWNPMRLHQRVGRLNRYGQKNRVEVLQIRNSDNVESRIWDKLNEKIEQISLALRASMSNPDDLMELVLGMTSPGMFQDLFADAPKYDGEKLSDFFDSATASFGGEDVLEVVRSIAGNVQRFDFGQSSKLIPRVDLPDLKSFFEIALILNGRRPQEDDSGLSFKTPERWLTSPAQRSSYSGIVFDRHAAKKNGLDRVFGVGHKTFDIAVNEARAREDMLASLPSELLDQPMLVFRIRDKITSEQNVTHPPIVVGYRPSAGGKSEISLKDWELLKQLNSLPYRKEVFREQSPSASSKDYVASWIEAGRASLLVRASDIAPEFRIPDIELIGMLLPQ